MRFWIVVGGSVLVLAAAIWPVGKKTEPPAATPATATAPPPATQTPEPPKVLEVIDLSRAYDPVREPDEPISPATFIEVPTQVERLDVMPREAEELVLPPDGIYRSGERLDVMPREVLDSPYRDLLEEVRRAGIRPVWSSNLSECDAPAWDVDGSITDWPPVGEPVDPIWPPTTRPAKYIPFLHGSPGIFMEAVKPRQLIAIRGGFMITHPSDAYRRVSLEDYVTRLDVMPRVVPSRFIVEDPEGKLLHYVEITSDAVVRVSGFTSPVDDHLTHPIPRRSFSVPLIPVEQLTVAPRVVPGE